jgi:hypothetical protein
LIHTKTRLTPWPLAGMALCLALGQTTPGVAAQNNTDPSTWSDARKEDFLLNAEAGVQREIGVGRNRTRRIAMSDGTTEHDAHFQTVDDSEPRMVLDNGTVILNFVDNYRFNIAAYRLDRLLGMNMVPVSVERSIGRERGALTWWVDDVQMMLLEYEDSDLSPPNVALWNHYMYHVRLFNELVYNFDANLQNVLVTNDWKLVMIDLTRAFKIDETLLHPENLEGIRIDRHVYHALQDLTFETLAETMGDLLTERQMRALLKRRDLIIEDLNEQIERRGEALVIRG